MWKFDLLSHAGSLLQDLGDYYPITLFPVTELLTSLYIGPNRVPAVNTKGFYRMGGIRFLSVRGMKWEEFCCGSESSSTTDHCNKSRQAAEASSTVLKQLWLHPCHTSHRRAELLASQPGFRLSNLQ